MIVSGREERGRSLKFVNACAFSALAAQAGNKFYEQQHRRKVVVIAGASGGLGEASARPGSQGYVKFRPLCRLSCPALNYLQPAGNQR
jgi:hypothetical protein